MESFAIYESPIGILEICESENKILSIDFVDEKNKVYSSSSILKECIRELDDYFNGRLKRFNLDLFISGSDFQKKVWKELMNIPYGEVVSYGEVARLIGNSKASRAVGNANNKNKIPIIIPCHRVVGSTGKLTGYAGGLWRKEWLLKHERRYK